MYTIWLTNHNYSLQDEFVHLDKAIERAQKTGFQCSIYTPDTDGERLVAAVCPLNGIKYY